MLVLTKAVLAMMIGFIIAVIFGLIAIPFLKRIARQKVSSYLEKKHKEKDGTPTMGGIIFIIPTLITTFILLLMGKIEFSDNLLIVIFVFIAYALLGFLVYNTHPAKVFMGDTGSLSLGATLASVAIITKHEITMIVVAGVFVFETLVCLIQIFSMVYLKRKVFLMTPYHHHLEKKGWDERDIVKFFWVIGLLLSMSAIVFGVWI